MFGRGSMEILEPANPAIFAYVREYEGTRVLCVNNLSSRAQQVDLDLVKYAGAQPIEMLGESRFRPVTTGPYCLTLAPYGFYWLRLEYPEDARHGGTL